MKKIPQSSLPEWYFYHRSHSNAYKERILQHFAPDGAIAVQEWDYFGRIKHYFWWLFSYGRFEKTDIEITNTLLAKYGFKRGLICWSWWRKEKPEWKNWIRWGYLFSKDFHHATRSAFSHLNQKEYFTSWASNARNHRKKVETLKKEGVIKILPSSRTEFLNLYQKIELPHSLKKYLTKKVDFLWKDEKNCRYFIACVDEKPLAWAFFLDDFPTSTYFVAFQDKKAKPYHLGLALINEWFRDSYEKGFLFLDLDHMKDMLDSSGYSWYTKFKSEIADYEVRFPSVYYKLFI